MNKQISLENETVKKEWEKEWIGMPEFIQGKQKAYAQIIIRFDNEADLQTFAKLVNQKLTKKTKSMWYPELKRGLHSLLRYSDES